MAFLCVCKGGLEPPKKAVQHDVGLVALRLLLLGFFLNLTLTPVGMWKSGGGWANRWAGVFLPVHRFVHALEPRSARQGRFPHIHGRQNQGGRDAAETAAGGRPAPFMADFQIALRVWEPAQAFKKTKSVYGILTRMVESGRCWIDPCFAE